MNVLVPESVPDALAALGERRLVIAGGTEVMPRLNNEPLDLDSLVSLRRAGLSGVSVEAGVATIGAATPLSKVDLPFLASAIESIASPTVRNLATVGGNLFVKQPYGDFAVCLHALDAEVQIDGERWVPVAEAAELVTAVRFAVPADGEWFYTKAMRRRQNSASIVTVAAVIREGHAALALGGVAPRPVRAAAAEAILARGLTPENVEAAAQAALEAIDPFDDAYASAWYRRRVVPVHVRRALLGE
jgi:CO/xanthine dehydrogenase FAD-binding subunit